MQGFQISKLDLPEEVAVKFLGKDDKLAKENLDRELGANKSLEHQNIVKTYGTCLIDGTPCLVTEVCETDLGKFLKDRNNKRLPPGLVWKILRQLCQGLAYLRSKGVIHRDLVRMCVLYILDSFCWGNKSSNRH